jgi:small ligand-binding sensory domain FIST
MQFAAAVSTREKGFAAGRELVDSVGERVPKPDLAVLLFTAPLLESSGDLAAAVREALAPRVLIGCSCESVIGGDREVERVAAASLLAGSLPGVDLRPFRAGLSDWRRLIDDPAELRDLCGAAIDHRGTVLMGDPMTTPVAELLTAFDHAFAGKPVVGGMASAGFEPGVNTLILNDEILHDGAVGVGLGGPIAIDTVVSQGCRPIGRPLVVTQAEENWIVRLSRRPAVEVANEMLADLPESERELVLRNGLFIGVVIDEYRENFHRGDFLIRHFMGADRESGAVAIGETVRPGQTIQFHVRDADTATEDLDLMMADQSARGPAAGGLLFTCNGRGTRMFEQPHHDVRAVLRHLPGLPLAGFFAAGELGPVGGKPFLHGHTASLALFRPGS